MIPINTQNAKLINILSKYSYSQIFLELKLHVNSKQIDSNYLADPQKTQLLLHNIASRLESLALACSDLTKIENQSKVQIHYNYIWNNNNENAQLRGIQAHYTGMIFRDLSVASGVDFTKLPLDFSAENLGLSQGLNIKLKLYVPRLEIPKEFTYVNGNSVRNAFEVTLGNIHSAVTGDIITYTNDKQIMINPCNKPIINNMPKSQKIQDCNREDPYAIMKEDFKIRTLDYLNKIEPEILSVGAVESTKEKLGVSNIAFRAIRKLKVKPNEINISDPKKNTAAVKLQILAKMQSTGDVQEAREILGIPVIYANKFIDS